MLTCPMCQKTSDGPVRQCPRCGTDLTLLTDYLAHCEQGLARADGLTRAGRLGEAVWTYLEVLEMDPDNAVARRQVAQVATAVRQFDRAATGRCWGDRLRQAAHIAGRVAFPEGRGPWLFGLVLVVLLVLCLFGGYRLGYHAGRQARATPIAEGTSP